jgi:hypothetical protein
VQNNELMRRAVEYARMVGVPVLDHCQDYNLVGNGVAHEGYWSTLLGLPGWPSAGEEAIVARNILLAELCDHHIHCQHISAAGSVRLLREARARGVKISGEICPHHIALTDEAIQGYDTNAKMNPPLRTQADVDALVEGIRDGTLDILASDHAPHALFEKEVEFDRAPFGILGLETELGLFLDLLVHKTGAIDLPRLIELYTSNPARLLNLERRHADRRRRSRCHTDRSGAGVERRREAVAELVVQHAVRRMETERSRRPDDRQWPDGVGLGARLIRIPAGDVPLQVIQRRALHRNDVLHQITDRDDAADLAVLHHR